MIHGRSRHLAGTGFPGDPGGGPGDPPNPPDNGGGPYDPGLNNPPGPDPDHGGGAGGSGGGPTGRCYGWIWVRLDMTALAKSAHDYAIFDGWHLLHWNSATGTWLSDNLNDDTSTFAPQLRIEVFYDGTYWNCRAYLNYGAGSGGAWWIWTDTSPACVALNDYPPNAGDPPDELYWPHVAAVR